MQTNSWFGQLLKMVLTASGVRYNIAQNGYVCFGSFFGGLIIQWGLAADYTSATYVCTLPITVNKGLLVLAGDTGAATISYGAGFKTNASVEIFHRNQRGSNLRSTWQLVKNNTNWDVILIERGKK